MPGAFFQHNSSQLTTYSALCTLSRTRDGVLSFRMPKSARNLLLL